MGVACAAELPQGIRLAAERFASACKRDGCGEIVASVFAENGTVVCITFDSTKLGVHESFVRLRSGEYIRSSMYKEVWNEQLP